MPAPDPEGFSLLSKVIGAAAAIVVPIGAAYKWIDSRFEKKADKEELYRQRDNIAKLFDKLDEHQRSDADNFSKVMDRMNEIHVDLIERLK